MDTLLRAINEPETIRVVAATTTEAVREACRRQEARGVAAIVIGRALTSGALLATLAKGERERVRIQLGGHGPVGQVIIDAHGDGRVRACVERQLSEAQLEPIVIGQRPSTASAVGTRGHVVVTRDLGLATPYQGTVDMRSGEVDEDLEHYLDASEQLPSTLRTEVVLDQHGEVLRAAGILAQSFPGSDPELIAAVRKRLAGDALRTIIAAHERELPRDARAPRHLPLPVRTRAGAERARNPRRQRPRGAGRRARADRGALQLLWASDDGRCARGPPARRPPPPRAIVERINCEPTW